MPHENDNTNPDQRLTDADRAAADRLRSAMAHDRLGTDLRARLMAGAAPAMEANRERCRSGRPSDRLVWRAVVRGGPWAAAAVLLLTVSVVLLVQRPSPAPQPRAASLDPMDTNADGVLDILDARALAVAVAAGNTTGQEDLNHDGVVSLADADAIARRVVRLGASG